MLNKDKIKEEFHKMYKVTDDETGEFLQYAERSNGLTIPDFLSAQYEKLIEEVIPEEKVLPRRFDCVDCIEIMKDLERDDATCAICNGERGFNSALSLIRTSLQERGIKIK